MTTTKRLLVLDDDPTGSQCVADVAVALEPDVAVIREALESPGSTCFVLTNTRAMEEEQAVELNRRILTQVIESGLQPEDLRVISRSDSTLRGHVLAEPDALADVLSKNGQDVDGILFCPAMLEAGRLTEHGVHYATVQGEVVEVATTDFAADPSYGYSHSRLEEFLEERSGGTVTADHVLHLNLEDIREGSVDRVAEILRGARERQWIVVDASQYADMETVVEAVDRLEKEGKVFLTRCAPSFVRPLSGQHEAVVLEPSDIPIAAGRQPHGLVVVGSHVGLTTRQLRVVQERSGLHEIEVSVRKLLDEDSRGDYIHQLAAEVREALSDHDVVLYTSRELVRAEGSAESLVIARSVSDAVVAIVQATRSARPAWVIAKGGITSHEVAVKGLGIRRATVSGQFFPGQISLFTPQDAPDEVRGMPYVVFPGNVGSEEALAEVIARLTAVVPAENTDDTAQRMNS